VSSARVRRSDKVISATLSGMNGPLCLLITWLRL
jgi:hypothetical protein